MPGDSRFTPRPVNANGGIAIWKYHALGNDYLVLPPWANQQELSPGEIRRICHRHFGAGSDGILFGPLASTQAPFSLKIYNPDGSEAEKSGNGLRIFARFLFDQGKVTDQPFCIDTLGGVVEARVLDQGRSVSVAMGALSFRSDRIPVTGPPREVLREKLALPGEGDLEFTAATIGNPHCVILKDALSEADTRRLGPLIETHEIFPNRINIQFMKIRDRGNIQIEIWERGAGYTLASGSSSCAAAGVAHRLGLCDREITVHMPGGRIEVRIDEGFYLTMQGTVTSVYEGILDPGVFA